MLVALCSALRRRCSSIGVSVPIILHPGVRGKPIVAAHVVDDNRRGDRPLDRCFVNFLFPCKESGCHVCVSVPFLHKLSGAVLTFAPTNSRSHRILDRLMEYAIGVFTFISHHGKYPLRQPNRERSCYQARLLSSNNERL